jgi:hypothetical protein
MMPPLKRHQTHKSLETPPEGYEANSSNLA